MSWVRCQSSDAPAGLGEIPTLNSDGQWYVKQFGAGWHRTLRWNGLGQDDSDNPPPIDSMPGSSTSNEAQDVGTGPDSPGPAVNTQINPNAAVDAGAQSSTQPAAQAPSSGGGSAPTPSAPTGDITPWIIGGVAIAGVAAVAYAYWKQHRRR